ncbi:MAG: sigma-70 family RNA polymerase sigma factor [Anaerolineales bacterium]|nr:sigma-70 family RNA polymerase sigma factor [Anaerolineales bacterium]
MNSTPRNGEIAGAKPTFDELFQAYWERVNGVIYRLVGDVDDAEDLALEVFWRLHTQMQSRRAPDHPGAWLYRSALNAGYNALRDRRRRRAYEESAGRLILESQITDPSQVAEQEQQRQWVRQALSALPKRSARLLVLRHAGCSYAELAQVLQVAPGSVGTLLARAEREFASRYRALVEKLEGARRF